MTDKPDSSLLGLADGQKEHPPFLGGCILVIAAFFYCFVLEFILSWYEFPSEPPAVPRHKRQMNRGLWVKSMLLLSICSTYIEGYIHTIKTK